MTATDKSAAPAPKAPVKSVLNESRQIERAAVLIGMGALLLIADLFDPVSLLG